MYLYLPAYIYVLNLPLSLFLQNPTFSCEMRRVSLIYNDDYHYTPEKIQPYFCECFFRYPHRLPLFYRRFNCLQEAEICHAFNTTRKSQTWEDIP